jgi:hypothetical protein
MVRAGRSWRVLLVAVLLVAGLAVGRPAGVHATGDAQIASVTILYATTQATYDTWPKTSRSVSPPRYDTFTAGTTTVAFYFEWTGANPKTQFQFIIHVPSGGVFTTCGPYALQYGAGWAMCSASAPHNAAYPDATYSVDLLLDGRVAASTSFTVGSGTITTSGLVIRSLSTTTPLPLTPLQIRTRGLDTKSPVTIGFSNGSGYSVTEKPIRIASNGTVVAAVPLYIDRSNGEIGPGAVSVVLRQGNHSSAPVTLDIQDLPHLSAYGTQLGQISHAVLVFDALLIAQRLNKAQTYQALPGHTVDTRPAQKTLKKLLIAAIEARSYVDQVMLDHSAVIIIGRLRNGTPLDFDAASLDMMDRVNAVFLDQAFGPFLVSPSSHAAAAALQTSFSRPMEPLNSVGAMPAASASRVPNASPILTRVLSAMQKAQGTSDIMAAIAGMAKTASATKDPVQALLDIWSAAAGGSLSVVADMKLIKMTELVEKKVGIAGAILSDARVLGDLTADYAALAMALIPAIRSGDRDQINWDLVQAAVDDMAFNDKGESKTSDYLKTAGDLALALVGGKGGEGLAELAHSTGSTLWNLIWAAKDYSKAVDNATEAEQAYARSVMDMPDPTAFMRNIATVEGMLKVPTDQGAGAPQFAIQMSSNGESILTLADPNGDFVAYLPLHDPNIDYQHIDVNIIDPVNFFKDDSGTIDTTVVDLRDLTPTVPYQLPIIHSQPCTGQVDFDDDDPDCD